MSIFAVTYTYSDDAAGRDAHRAEHRQFLAGLTGDVEVVLSGPLAEGTGQPDGALLLVSADSAAAVNDTLAQDPFQLNGLVATVEVRGWNPVLGSWHERVTTGR